MLTTQQAVNRPRPRRHWNLAGLDLGQAVARPRWSSEVGVGSLTRAIGPVSTTGVRLQTQTRESAAPKWVLDAWAEAARGARSGGHPLPLHSAVSVLGSPQLAHSVVPRCCPSRAAARHRQSAQERRPAQRALSVTPAQRRPVQVGCLRLSEAAGARPGCCAAPRLRRSPPPSPPPPAGGRLRRPPLLTPPSIHPRSGTSPGQFFKAYRALVSDSAAEAGRRIPTLRALSWSAPASSRPHSCTCPGQFFEGYRPVLFRGAAEQGAKSRVTRCGIRHCGRLERKDSSG